MGKLITYNWMRHLTKLVSMNTPPIYYDIIGKGKPIVWLHGFLEDHRIWDKIYPQFLDLGYQNILIDLPCHGQSRFAGDYCSMKQVAEIVHQILEKHSIENPVVIGHSMGGYVGLEMLELSPIQLTLLHSNFWEDSASKKLDRNRVIEVVQKNKGLFLQEAIPNLFAAENREKCKKQILELIERANAIPIAEICAVTAGLRDRSDWTKLMTLHKVNIIQGEKDKIVPLDLMRINCEKLQTNQQIRLLKNVGHMSMFENTDALINQLKSILIE